MMLLLMMIKCWSCSVQNQQLLTAETLHRSGIDDAAAAADDDDDDSDDDDGDSLQNDVNITLYVHITCIFTSHAYQFLILFKNYLGNIT